MRASIPSPTVDAVHSTLLDEQHCKSLQIGPVRRFERGTVFVFYFESVLARAVA
jgi:hypothetical protein